MKDVNLDKMSNVPFQCKIEYTDKNGDRFLRVVTKKLSICSDKKNIEKQASVSIMAANAIQKCQQIARDYNFREAQCLSNAWEKL